MSRSTLLGGGGEQTSRLKNSQNFEEAGHGRCFRTGLHSIEL